MKKWAIISENNIILRLPFFNKLSFAFVERSRSEGYRRLCFMI